MFHGRNPPTSIELCRRIWAVKSKHYIYVVFLTVVHGKTRYLEAMDAGADDFLSKPLDREQLAARLRVAERILGLHKEIGEVVDGLLKRGKFVYLCTNALLMEKRIDQYKPSPYFVWSVHLDGSKEMHDKSVCQAGVYERAVAAIKLAKSKGFRVNINCTLFNNVDPDEVATFFEEVKALGVDAMTVSPGYAYERAPDQQHFLNREKTKQLFRDILRRGKLVLTKAAVDALEARFK